MGTQKNRFIEIFLLSIHNRFWLRNKKIIFLCTKQEGKTLILSGLQISKVVGVKKMLIFTYPSDLILYVSINNISVMLLYNYVLLKVASEAINQFSFLSTKTYCITHKNSHNETILLSSQNKCFN